METKTIVGISCFSALLVGMLFYAYYHSWIVFTVPHASQTTVQTQTNLTSKKEVDITYFKHDAFQQERKELIWSNQPVDNLVHLVQTWLSLLDEEELLLKKTSLQTITVSNDQETATISFDQAPFNDQDATSEKLAFIESLLSTLRPYMPKLKQIRLLVHHQPINDYHLDFSCPWPVGGFLTPLNDINLDAIKPWQEDSKKSFTIMLDPAGDAQNTGRIIGDSFERGVTLQYAVALKKALESRLPQARIILTRFPGETLEPLQNAAFSNRLQADLYISFSFYPAYNDVPRCSLYYFVYDPITDVWHKKGSHLSFASYNKAHLLNGSVSQACAHSVNAALKETQKAGVMQLNPVVGIPFKPLVGVQATAIGCEIGLHNKEDWNLFVEPMARAIATLV